MDRINITGESSIDRADAERAGMDRVNAIWNHPVYQKYYRRLEKLEEKRIFCRHQMTHLLDVAKKIYRTREENDTHSHRGAPEAQERSGAAGEASV